jgi:RNA recognition motif-containing protein
LKGYAFVNLSTPSETKRAIAELSGKEIRGSSVTIQLARSKPTPAGEKRKKRERAARGGEGISGGESGCPGDGDCTARDVDNHLNQEMNVEANNDGHNYEEEVSFTEHSTERDSDYHLNEEMDFAELNADGRQVVLDVPPIPSTPPSGYTVSNISLCPISGAPFLTGRAPVSAPGSLPALDSEKNCSANSL